MIDTTELEKRLKELEGTEESNKPFNKWTSDTRYQIVLDNFNSIKRRNQLIIYRKHQLVIDDFKIVRLDDVEDGGDDYYWVYNQWVGMKGIDEQKTGKYQASCVGEFTPLKGIIPDDDYYRMVHIWNLNNYVKAI